MEEIYALFPKFLQKTFPLFFYGAFAPSFIWCINHINDVQYDVRTCSSSDKKEKVRWPVTPELLNAHARQFTFGLAHFRVASYGKIALMSNISKMVTDTTMGSMEAEYETDPEPSTGTAIFDHE